jgi:hypothetical protein
VILAAVLYLTWADTVTGPQHLAVNLLASYLIFWGLLLLFSSASRDEMCVRFALMSVSIFVAFVCLEAVGVLGFVDYRALFSLRGMEAMVSPAAEQEPGLLRVHIRQPHARFSGVMKGNLATSWCLSESARRYPYKLRYDHRGFRNESDLDVADAVVIGDSYIEALEVQSHELITSVLARLSGRTVVNLGRQGFGPPENLVVLKRYALPMRPKVIVWMFFEGNDLQDLVDYEHLMAEEERARKRRVRRGAPFLKSMLELLQRAVGCQPNPTASRRSGVFRTADGHDVRMYFGEVTSPASQNEAAFDRFRDIVAEAYELARGQGAELAITYVPIALRVYRDVVRFPRDTECLDVDLSDMPDRVRRVTSSVSHQISYIDLTPAFVAAARRGQLVYLPDDTHWSPEGHRLAAETLNEALFAKQRTSSAGGR